MALYSKFAYGSQFSGEKIDLKIRYLVAEILSTNGVLFFWGHPVYYVCYCLCPCISVYYCLCPSISVCYCLCPIYLLLLSLPCCLYVNYSTQDK